MRTLSRRGGDTPAERLALRTKLCYNERTAPRGISKIAALVRSAYCFLRSPMYVRILKSSLKPNCSAGFTEAFENEVIPTMRAANGFHEAMALVGPVGNEIVSISLWDSKESADAYNTEQYPEVLKKLATVIEGIPNVRTYEVTNSTRHKIPVHAEA
jgi:quinol monooxygenase YgiN